MLLAERGEKIQAGGKMGTTERQEERGTCLICLAGEQGMRRGDGRR